MPFKGAQLAYTGLMHAAEYPGCTAHGECKRADVSLAMLLGEWRAWWVLALMFITAIVSLCCCHCAVLPAC